MADDKKKRGKPDRSKVSGKEDYEVKYTATKTHTTPAQVKAAIKKVGNTRTKVEAELKKVASKPAAKKPAAKTKR